VNHVISSSSSSAPRISPAADIRGVLSGLGFLLSRVPIYLGVMLFAALVAATGVVLVGIQSLLGGARG
jgi:hypothetical protein